MIAYKKERFIDIIRELPELFTKHWIEIETDHELIPLAPNWDKYIGMEKAGVLHVMAVRDEEKLVGYAFLAVLPHLHYCTTVMGWSDILYLLPSYRRGFNGIKLLTETEKMAGELGAKRLYIIAKVNRTFGRVLKRLGYVCVEEVHSKLI